ncbi:MAG: hypothetical protein GYB32_12850 [Algicola sp.]|nr:hypothetical protein [Algicola sp.]
MKQRIVTLSLMFFVCFKSVGQCAMCRAVLESEESQSTAEGVNDGIMYLMAIPYILVFGIGVLIYWNYFRRNKNMTKDSA